MMAISRAAKYRRDAEAYAYQQDIYASSRSKWGREQFARYARLAAQALEKAMAYERSDMIAIAAIERDNERVEAAMMGEEHADRDSYTQTEAERWLRR